MKNREDYSSFAASEGPHVNVNMKLPTKPLLNMASPDMSPMAAPASTVNIMWYLRDIEDEVRKDLAEFLCTGNFNALHMNSDNVETYFYISNSLQLRSLKKHCQTVCVDTLQKENCLHLLQVAESYKCPYLLRHSMRMVVEHFGELWNTDEFQCLGTNHIMKLLKNPDIHDHPDVQKALTHWFLYEKEFRQDSYQDMVSCIEVIEDSEQNEAALNGNVEQQSGNNNVKSKYVVMFAIEDGSDEVTAVSINSENYLSQQEKLKHHLRFPGTEFDVCSMEIEEAPYIFVSGGKQQAASQFLKYDVILDKWKKCKKMKFGRSRHNMVAVNENLYVIGGFDGSHQLKSIEKYDPSTDSWVCTGCDLVVPVRSAACAVYNEKIYIFGGRVADNRRVATVQCYDPAANTIRRLPNLPYVNSCGRAVAIGHSIYIASGQGHMIRFDPETETYHVLQRQPFHRSHFGMFAKGQKLYIAGGMNLEGHYFDCMYEFDPDINVWKSHGKIPIAAPVFGACEVNFKPFVQER